MACATLPAANIITRLTNTGTRVLNRRIVASRNGRGRRADYRPEEQRAYRAGGAKASMHMMPAPRGCHCIRAIPLHFVSGTRHPRRLKPAKASCERFSPVHRAWLIAQGFEPRA